MSVAVDVVSKSMYHSFQERTLNNLQNIWRAFVKSAPFATHKHTQKEKSFATVGFDLCQSSFIKDVTLLRDVVRLL